MTLMKRRATFEGMLQRVPAQSAGEKPTYLLVASVSTVVVKGQQGGVADVPLVVQAPGFGKEDLSGPVRITVLIEQLPA